MEDIHKDRSSEMVSAGSSEGLVLHRIEPTLRQPLNRTYFWGQAFQKGERFSFPVSKGYAEERKIIGEGGIQFFDELSTKGLEFLKLAFKELGEAKQSGEERMVPVKLSDELQRWREEQHEAGHTLPSKGYGLTRASDEVIERLHMADFPPSLLTNGAIYGCGFANMLIGAYDAETLYSTYCNDMCFYYEHNYHRVFPEFEALVRGDADRVRTASMPGARERVAATDFALLYIRGKVALEEQYKTALANRTVRMNRREAIFLFCCESSIWGMAAEAIARGYDAAGVLSDFVFSSPGTDVVDVGSDLQNSEAFNSFLNTADITDAGVVSEPALRRVYDAYAHSGARMFTQRWSESGARLCATLYTWHIQNNRHGFFRRALLGYPRSRRVDDAVEQREGDFCEVFDEDLRTTGFSRPLQDACDGGDPCDHVRQRIDARANTCADDGTLMARLWWLLATGPVEYIRGGVLSQEREEKLGEDLRLAMADMYALGLIDELSWLMSHAGHHAWQVNRMFEAAMFGSLLDDGGLRGKLDRKN